MQRVCVPVGVDRDHTIYRYTDSIYKIVQFYELRKPVIRGDGEVKHYDHKLDCSLSRARKVVLEKALCNPWEYFCTFTIAKDKHDRKNLIAWRDKFTQFIRDQRKKFPGLAYILVPEQHGDGSWHAHGLFYGLPESELKYFADMDAEGYRTAEGRRLPKKLRFSAYMNWLPYMQRFGFCSFGKIKNQTAAAFYIVKYITKDSDRLVQDVGLHTYYCSRGLKGAEKHLAFYGRDPELDKFLVNEYQYCRTGMTHLKDHCDWTFGYQYLDFSNFENFSYTENVSEADDMYQMDQLNFFKTVY